MISVLYVDDEPGLLEIGKRFLEQRGLFSVDTVSSATEALLAIAVKSYDAIISDYQMPEMDGIELLKRVRASGNTIPFIIFTGRGREEIVIQALNEGADFYLQKGGEPVSQFAELAHKLQMAVMQRKAEMRVRDHERREAEIINFLPDATFAIDNQGIVIAWNRAMEQMTGIPSSDILGKGNYEYALPIYRERRPILIDLVLRDDPETEGRYPYIRRSEDKLFSEIIVPHLNDGKGATIWFTASPLYDTQGQIVGAIESIRDITGRKDAEKALNESEKRFRELSDLLPQVVYEADASGVLTYANRIAFDLFGYTREDFSSGLYALEMIAPSDRVRAGKAFQDVIRGNPPPALTGEYMACRKDGSIFPISIYSSPIIVNGRIVGIRGIIVDITEGKQRDHILHTQLDLGIALQSARGLYDTMKTCLDSAIKISGMDAGGIYQVNGTDGSIDLIVSQNLGDEFLKSVSHYPSDSDNSRMVLKGKPIYTHYRDTGVVHSPVQEREGLKAAAIIPISHNNVIIACLNITSHTNCEVPPIARISLETIATQIGAAIERIRKDEALMESELRYRNVVEDQTEFISRFLPDGTHVFVNEAYCRYFGLNRDEILGGHFQPKIPVEDQGRVRLFFESLTPDHPVGIIEHRIIMNDGGIRWQRWSDRAIFDPSGALVEYQSVGRDITDKKEAEIALQASEQRYRTLLTSVNEGIWVIDADAITTYVNPIMAGMLGYSVEEMVGKDLFFFIDETWRSVLVGKIPELMAEVREQHEFVFIRKDGSYLTSLLSTSPLYNADGSFAGGIATVIDISRRKWAEEALRESEERLKLTFEATHDGIWDWNLPTGDATFSPHYYTMLGYEPYEFPENYVSWRNLIHPDDILRVEQEIDLALKKGDASYAIELRMRTKDGEWKWILTRGKVVERDPAGKPVRMVGTHTDISDRKVAEEKLHVAYQEYHALLEQIQDVYYRADSGGRLIRISRSMAEMLGYGEIPELLGRKIAEDFYLDPAARSKFLEEIHRSGKVTNYEVYLKKKDGTPVLISASSHLWYNSDGSVGGVEGTFRDVTAEKKIADALRESEEKYRLLYEQSNDAIFIADPETRMLIDCNKRAEYLTGYSRKEILSMEADKLHPEDVQERTMEYFRNYAMGMDTSVESVVITKNSKRVPVSINANRIEISGRTSLIGIFRDITDQKNAEDTLRQRTDELDYRNRLISTLLDTVPIGIFMVEAPSGKPIVANREAIRLLGRGILPDTTGSNIGEVYGAYRLVISEPYPTKDMPVIRGMEGETSHVDDMVVVRPDGSQVRLEIFGAPILDSQGNVVASLVSFMDITERKRAEQTLQETNKKINLLNSITRHDVANQVTILKGFAQIALMSHPDPVVADFLSKIDAAGSTIALQIEFTKTYQELGMHVPGWYRISEMVSQPKPENLTISCTCNAEIFADPMLGKVFFNLIDNSVRHGERVTEIRIGCEEDQEGLSITVEDNGTGISPDKKEKIFEKGYGKNTGFGLFLAREILAITGITIREAGKPGKGAMFVITVPKGSYRALSSG